MEDEQEDETRTEETEQKQQLLRRESSPPSQPYCKDVRYDDLPPVKLSWKQKFLVLIGVEDKGKLEAKLRRQQLAQTAYGPDDDEEEHYDRPEEKRRYSSSTRSSDNKSKSEKSSVILPGTTSPQIREPLEEASSSTNNENSDPQSLNNNNIQRNIRPRVQTPATVIGSPKGRTPSRSPWAGSSHGTGGTDEDTGELPTIINIGQ